MGKQKTIKKYKERKKTRYGSGVNTPKFRGVEKIRKNGKVVASGHNLAVVTRYQRDHSFIKKVEQKGQNLTVYYEDGSVYKTKFADSSVLENWIHNKRRRGTFP